MISRLSALSPLSSAVNDFNVVVDWIWVMDSHHFPSLSCDGIALRLDVAYSAQTSPWGVPAWRFDIMEGPIRVGTISLRAGTTYRVTHLAGQVGFVIEEAFRGRSLAVKAARALLPVATAQGMHKLWLTTTPDNIASQRTLEKVGCAFVESVDIPEDYPSYARGERIKLRYSLACATE
jgi:RimJ/RimL family protein N-acetyltransferase